MGRKVHSKKLRSREGYLAAKGLGGIVMTNTSNGVIALNVMKHYCMNKPYVCEEYRAIMTNQVKTIMNKVVTQKAIKAKEAQAAGATAVEV